MSNEDSQYQSTRLKEARKRFREHYSPEVLLGVLEANHFDTKKITGDYKFNGMGILLWTLKHDRKAFDLLAGRWDQIKGDPTNAVSFGGVLHSMQGEEPYAEALLQALSARNSKHSIIVEKLLDRLRRPAGESPLASLAEPRPPRRGQRSMGID